MTEKNSTQHLLTLEKKTINEQEKTISEQEKTISEQEKTISEQYKTIKEQKKTIAEQDKKIRELKAEFERYKKQELKSVDCWLALSTPMARGPKPNIKPIFNSENELIHYVVETKAGTKTELSESFVEFLLEDDAIVKKKDPKNLYHYLDYEFEFKSMKTYEAYMEGYYDGLHCYDPNWRDNGEKPWLP